MCRTFLITVCANFLLASTCTCATCGEVATGAGSVFAESLYEKLEIIQVEGFIIARERYSGE